jgi:hypothetical protein
MWGSGVFDHDYTSPVSGVRIFIDGSFNAASPPKATGDLTLSKSGCPVSSTTWSAMKQ